MAFIIIIIHRKSAGISCESSAWQTIHMKYQDLISMKNKKKKKIKRRPFARRFKRLKINGSDSACISIFTNLSLYRHAN